MADGTSNISRRTGILMFVGIAVVFIGVVVWAVFHGQSSNDDVKGNVIVTPTTTASPSPTASVDHQILPYATPQVARQNAINYLTAVNTWDYKVDQTTWSANVWKNMGPGANNSMALILGKDLTGCIAVECSKTATAKYLSDGTGTGGDNYVANYMVTVTTKTKAGKTTSVSSIWIVSADRKSGGLVSSAYNTGQTKPVLGG